LHPLAKKYSRGAEPGAAWERLRVFKLIRDLAASEYSGYWNTEIIHGSGSPAAEILAMYREADLDHCKAIVERALSGRAAVAAPATAQRARSRLMSFRVAVDTGGTFSDVVLADDEGHFSLSKAPTTPDKIFDGISQALEFAAAERSLELRDLLEQTEVVIYATTRSTNAIITGTTARTALITTKGFPDTPVFPEGGKLRPFDFRQPYPEPYIPRRLTFEVPE